MKRRLVLMIATFLVLLAAFGIYKIQTVGLFSKESKVPVTPTALQRPTASAPVDQVAEELYLVQRDDQGRLEAIYQARTLQRLKDGSVLLDQPHFIMYYKDGMQLHIQADKGSIYAEQVAKKLKLRRGQLKDNVRIVLDRSTSPDRAEINKRPDDLVTIKLDEVDFDNDLLEINSKSPVTVRAADVDIDGTGLQIQINQQPSDLRELRLLNGRKVIVRNVPEDIDVMALPGEGESTATMPAETAGMPTAPDIETLSVVPTTRPTPIEHIAAGHATQPESVPVVASTTAPAKRQNIYQLEFTDAANNLSVISGDRQLTGAGKLSLLFDTDSAKKKKSTPATNKAATGKTPAANNKPAASTKPPQTMIITWNGPLVLRPVGHTEKPSNKSYTVTATGPNITLINQSIKNQQTTAICREFEYQSKPTDRIDEPVIQMGTLKGTATRPVLLTMAGGDSVECETMSFDRQKQIAHLEGPGKMIRRSMGATFSPDMLTAAVPATQPTSTPIVRDQITWTKSVDAGFAQMPTISPDEKKKNSMFIKDAKFRGDVRLVSNSADNKTTNYVNCDELYTVMAVTPDGKQYPAMAQASGNVRASQDSSNIVADRLNVTMKLIDETGTDGRIRNRVVDDVLEAYGTPAQPVQVEDVRDPTQKVHATGTEIRSQTVRDITTRKAYRKATLKGKPARVMQGINTIEGPEIQLDEQGEMATVIGAGELQFASNKDLEGRDLSAARTVTVDWTNKMDYRGSENKALFTGGVKLVSQDESLACQSMTLTFESKLPVVGAGERIVGLPATRPATKPAEPRKISLGMEKFSSRKLKTVQADKKVVLKSIRQRLDVVSDIRSTYMYAGNCPLRQCFNPDREFYLTQRLLMTAEDSLTYDVATKMVDVVGPGALFVDDYNAPDKSAGGETYAMRVEKPAQTLFTWTKHMQWVQSEFQMTMTGDVNMVRRSGEKMLKIKELRANLNLPPWPANIGAKESYITAHQLTAKFGKPLKEVDGQAVTGFIENGPNIGPLKEFIAVGLPRAVSETGTVSLTDGPMEIHGRQINYNIDGAKTQIDIYGYLNGETPTKATFANEDTSKPFNLSFPSMRVIMRNGQIVKVQPTEGFGGSTVK